MTHILHRAALVLLSLAMVGLPGGCTIEEGNEQPPPAEVVVEPGYYYDADYYDFDGRFHPREFWYYDGRRYWRRDVVPHDFVPHERPHWELEHGDHGQRGTEHHESGHEEHGDHDR